MEEDLAERFWNEWLDADHLKRLKLLRKTQLVRELAKHLKGILSPEQAKSTVAQLLEGYLEDLEQAIVARMEGKEKLRPEYEMELKKIAKGKVHRFKGIEDLKEKIRRKGA